MKTSRALVTLWAGALLACASGPALAQEGDVQRGISLYNEGKYPEASAALQGQGGVEAQAYLAASLAKQKQYAEAIGAANAALGGDPTHPVAVAALGESLVGKGYYDEAVTRLSGVLARRNDVAYAYYWRGQAYSKKKEASRMVNDYETFVRLAPDTPEAATVRQLLAALH